MRATIVAGSVRLRVHPVRLVDHEVWRCAREAMPEHRALLVELSADGQSGWGEASAFMTGVYNSSLPVMIARLRQVMPLVQAWNGRDPAALVDRMAPMLTDSPFVLAALDTAAYDLAARLSGVSLHKHLGLASPTGLRSGYSIGLDELPAMVDKLVCHPGWAQYKVKLSSPADISVLRALRVHTAAPFWVDGNACWCPADLLPVLDTLADLGVTAIEQPYPVDFWHEQAQLRRSCPLPVYADESVTTPQALARAADCFDGINVKVQKAGGIGPALTMLREARRLGLSAMLGCLPESSAGASAAAHLAVAADHVDLDTVALLKWDTGEGVTLSHDGTLTVPLGAGSGFTPNPTSPAWHADPATGEYTRGENAW